MAKQYDNANTGVLFVNDRKTTDRHPDFKGNAEIKVRGKTFYFWASGWVNETNGKERINIRFEEKDYQPVDGEEKTGKATSIMNKAKTEPESRVQDDPSLDEEDMPW